MIRSVIISNGNRKAFGIRTKGNWETSNFEHHSKKMCSSKSNLTRHMCLTGVNSFFPTHNIFVHWNNLCLWWVLWILLLHTKHISKYLTLVFFFHIENDIDRMETAFKTSSILFQTKYIVKQHFQSVSVVSNQNEKYQCYLASMARTLGLIRAHTHAVWIILFHFSFEWGFWIENNKQKNPPPVVVLMFVHKYSI